MRDKIAKEMKIKLGTENMLEALMSKNAKQTRDQRQRIELELGSSNRKLADLRLELEQEVQRSQIVPTTPPTKRVSAYFKGSPLKPSLPDQITETDSLEHSDGESPTVVLTDTLQALEVEGMQPGLLHRPRQHSCQPFQEEPHIEVRPSLGGLQPAGSSHAPE